MRGSRIFSLISCLVALSLVSCAKGDGAPVAGEGPAAPPVETQPPVVAKGEMVCGEVALTRRPLQFCYRDRADQARSGRPMLTILYTFHGLGGSVRGDFDQVYDALSRLLGNEMPVVASLSLGSSGVMGDEATEVERIAIPEIERRIGGDRRFRRVLLGGSMGGHNVMRLLASAERDRYAGAAAVCPALATFNGHRPEEVEAYKRRNAAVLDMDFFERALATYKVELPTESIWEANNPFTLLANGAYVGTPIFISVGTEDSVGFLEGSREFRDRAQRYPGVDVEYHEVGGKHCAFDFPALMRFLFGRFRG